jgi:hypothetical protein
MATKAPVLLFRWKRQPNARGLARVGQGERGWELWTGDKRVGSVSVRYVGFGRERSGYYAVVREDSLGVLLINTCGEPVPSIPDAMTQAEEHIRKALGDRYSPRFNRSAYIRTVDCGVIP